MESHLWWAPLRETGLEQLDLMENEMGVVADSLVLGVEQAPFRLWYQVRADSKWNVRECHLQVGGEKGRVVHLYSDGMGHWNDGDGEAYANLDGCLDVDITVTPFTNTLPIRRLLLAPGQSADLLVAYISVPDLSVRAAQQRYTCLSRTASGGLYRYEGLESGFTADLRVDAQGLVVDYPGIWRRVEMRPDGNTILSQPPRVLEGLLANGPHPERADQLQLFGQFVGDWEADWTGYQPDGKGSQTGKGEIHFAWVLEGRAIQDVWIFPTREELRQGVPMDEWGSTMRFYDPSIDVWKITFYGAVNNIVRTMTARAVGDEIWVEGNNLKGEPLRWVFSEITGQTFHWSNFVSRDGGQIWYMQEELEARRMEH
ncbi:MAG TPA: putative glycolipid-binding domain-containing protein [Ktedonosporobacter sp.]|nr:putative glycolipid-binding domain-containing protein [Ktedonosporobacter sp.]